jgi:hypothetical protein
MTDVPGDGAWVPTGVLAVVDDQRIAALEHREGCFDRSLRYLQPGHAIQPDVTNVAIEDFHLADARVGVGACRRWGGKGTRQAMPHVQVLVLRDGTQVARQHAGQLVRIRDRVIGLCLEALLEQMLHAYANGLEHVVARESLRDGFDHGAPHVAVERRRAHCRFSHRRGGMQSVAPRARGGTSGIRCAACSGRRRIAGSATPERCGHRCCPRDLAEQARHDARTRAGNGASVDLLSCDAKP